MATLIGHDFGAAAVYGATAIAPEKVKKLATELEHSTSAIIGTFKGLTASKDFELRKAVRGAGGSYNVVKNNQNPFILLNATNPQASNNNTFVFGLWMDF